MDLTSRTRQRQRLFALVLACSGLGSGLSAQEAQTPTSDEETETRFEDEIDVVGLTPLDRSGIPAEELPFTRHRLGEEELESITPLGLGALIENLVPGVHLNEAQGNPLQADLHYRGFSTSPLLGASQELTVYEDGVRVNEVFGDTLAWDLVPAFALEEVELTSGANPIYGDNALGGALRLETRNGFSEVPLRLGLSAGSFKRRAVDVAASRDSSLWAGFGAVHGFDEDGWRDFSPSEVRQALAKLSRRSGNGGFEIGLGLGDNDLIGNGSTPVQLLEIDRSAVFTHPDRTQSQLLFPRLRLTRTVGSRVDIEGLAYLRRHDIESLNADAYEGDDDDVESELDAVDNHSSTDQEGAGASIQIGWTLPGKNSDHRLIGALTWDEGSADFRSESELGRLTPTRTTIPSGIFLEESRIAVDSEVERIGINLAAHTRPARRLTMTAAFRYSDSRIRLEDRIGTELSGNHHYDSLLPSIGIAWSIAERPESNASLFFGFSRSARVPTPVELTCADPSDPCPLPNAFVSDPPLEQVTTSSAELGLRGRVGNVQWNGALFSSESSDDLIFVSSGASTSAGYFTNVEGTERRGLELSTEGRHGKATWRLSYTYVEATFQDTLTFSSPEHPAAENGEIRVQPGDFLPGVPRHQLRAGLDRTLGNRFRIGVQIRHDSSRFLRGDENNRMAPVEGATVADAWFTAAILPSFDLELRLNNLTDEEYATFGGLGDASEVLTPAFDDPRFLSPGAPAALLLSLRARFGQR